MGSELHAGSLATHWFLVLNFKRFPRYASMNLSWYFPGNSNGLGYSNLWEDQSPFWCAAAAALLPHVLGAAVPSWGRDGWSKLCLLVAAAHGPHTSSTSAAQQQSSRGGHKHKIRRTNTGRDAKQKCGRCLLLAQRWWGRGNDQPHAGLHAPAAFLAANLGRFDPQLNSFY